MLQNTIARSHAALPLTTIYALALWALQLYPLYTELSVITLEGWHEGLSAALRVATVVLFLVSTYLMVELNNRNTLMHTYSRMVSCSFIALTMMCLPLTIQPKVMAVQMCVIVALTLFFQTYQNRDSVGTAFFAYLMIGIASMLWPPIVAFLPLLWIAQAKFMMSFSWRTLMASLFGIITPYWIATPVILYLGKQDEVLTTLIDTFTPNDKVQSLFTDITQVVLSPSLTDHLLLASALLIAIMLITGIIHYFRNYQKDKLKVSMIYQFLLIIALPTLLAMILVAPVPFDTAIHFHMLIAILIVLTAPFIAHYITLTSTKLTNFSVIMMILLVIAITALNYIPKELLPFAL